MSAPERPAPGPWRSARYELAVAAAILTACAVSAYAVAGGPAVVVVVIVFSAIALLVVNRLLPARSGPPTSSPVPADRPLRTGSINYWRLRTGLADAMTSLPAYRAGLGPHLEHLLAARLSERHGVSLYHEPERARSILCANAKDADLWSWVDPGRADADQAQAPGISPKTLARLVQRLEQL